MSEVNEPVGPKLKPVHIQPTLRLDTTDMPEVADYDVGETYDAVVHCEMVSKHAGDSGPFSEDVPGVVRGTFKVLSIKPLNSTNKSTTSKMKAINKKASNY